MSHSALVLHLVLLLLPLQPVMGETPAAESARIECLIAHIEGLADVRFIRNGTAYDSKTAARFLRGKWHHHESDIQSTTDFIEKAASFSGTTGKPYTIRFKDGTEKPCGTYLRSVLKEAPASQS